MASFTPVAQAPAASEAPAPVLAKTFVATQAKNVDSKATSSLSKAEGSTIVEKTN